MKNCVTLDSAQMDREYLTFILEAEEYGVDILCVQEIRVWSDVTNIPNMPEYLKGVINLRGSIIPIVDLRARFNKKPLVYGPTTVVVILRTQVGNQPNIVGIVVDAVSEVYKINQKNIKASPDFGNQIDNVFIEGMVTVEDKMVVVLNAEKLLDVNFLYKMIQPIQEKMDRV